MDVVSLQETSGGCVGALFPIFVSQMKWGPETEMFLSSIHPLLSGIPKLWWVTVGFEVSGLLSGMENLLLDVLLSLKS